ncbi:MAG: response regulator transcription factor [Firmicutes bacterium]|nr:response regulator transcription factor [Bacillota bacterium]
MKRKILLIEDNNDLCDAIKDYFIDRSDGGFILDSIHEGNLSLASHPINDYDLIILDILLPGMDGFSLCKEIRKNTGMPIIFLTALVQEKDRIMGYELGADDYVIKPFSMPEFYLKVNAWINRSQGISYNKTLTFNEICLDLSNRTCIAKDEAVILTYIEFEILQCFVENKNKVISREMLLNKIWADKLDTNDRTVDSHIKKIRKVLGRYGKYIKTVRNVGYVLKD